jgi:hypothetical protein
MKAPFRSVLWLLPVLLAGCTHKTQQAQMQPLAPPIIDTPPPSAQPAPADLPPPVVTVPQQPQPQQQAEPEAPHKTETKPAHRSQRHPKPEQPKPAEQSSSSTGPEVSAIGQLTSGDSGDLRSQTEQAVASIDQGLKKITRPLSGQEQKTAAQIREFLKQARTALSAGDVDGAHTLAIKARVLLGELSK